MSFRCVTSGFRQDVEELINRFITGEGFDDKTVSLRFSRFSNIWRQMKFSLVFRHRINENDLKEFVDESYLVVLPNIGSEYPLERRVCALYLLYSLYAKQPKPVYQTIRMSFAYLAQIGDLINTCKHLDQLDVCYIWHRLWSLGAIDIVVVSRRMGPYYIRNSRVTDGTDARIEFIVDQFKTSVYPPFNELSHIHHKYHDFVKGLSEDSPDIKIECDLNNENIFESGKQMAEQMLKSVTIKAIKTLDIPMDCIEANHSEEYNESNTKTLTDIGSKRRYLKERSLNCETQTQNGYTLYKIDRLYESTVKNESNKKKSKGKKGRPKVCKWTENN